MLSQVEAMLSFYERRAEDSAVGRRNALSLVEEMLSFKRGGLRTVPLEGRMLSQVEEMLSFYKRGAEDSAVGRKNAEPSGRNAVFL
jgi:hypothetical protein